MDDAARLPGFWQPVGAGPVTQGEPGAAAEGGGPHKAVPPGAEAADSGDSGRAENRVQCGLCFRACVLAPDQRGFCGARLNREGRLHSPFLGRFVSIAIDPIEKKPLYHWRPGTDILSLGSVGCTMHCPFCQNSSIAHPARWPEPAFLPVPDLVLAAKKHRLSSVAFTYNEPALQAEYILASAPALRDAEIATVMVTNGMFSPELLRRLCACVEAVNIDCKTFSEKNYTKLGGSLEVMKRSVRGMKEAGVHVEITCLVVPGISDSEEEFAAMAEWAASLDRNMPFHISRYFPRYQYTAPQTSMAVLERFETIARARLARVHLGNIGRR